MNEICITYPDSPFRPGARVIINNKIIDSANLRGITLTIQEGEAPKLNLRYSSGLPKEEKDLLESM